MLTPWLGEDFFPAVDAGQFKIHIRAQTGTRIEETAALCDQIENTIRQQIPARELATIIDNIGLPYSSTNLAYTTRRLPLVLRTQIFSQVQLTGDHHRTEQYIERIHQSGCRAVSGRDVLYDTG